MKYLKKYENFKSNEEKVNSFDINKNFDFSSDVKKDIETITRLGKYLTLEVLPNALKISLTDDGREKIAEDGISEQNFFDFFEDITTNSEYTYHPDLGEMGFGLTSAPGISDGYFYDDDGKFTDDGYDDSKLYIYDNYMITDFTEKLENEGFVIFQKV